MKPMRTNCRNPRCGDRLVEDRFGLCPACWLMGKWGATAAGTLAGTAVVLWKVVAAWWLSS